jgi:putative protease
MEQNESTINTKFKHECELLAPAGDADSFFAAVNNGADAVYLGLSDFNARKMAQNFTADNIRFFTQYAHLRGVKVYIALNTLVFDGEFEKMLSLARAAAEAKCDAFIVQDLGVAEILKNQFPQIPLHASTQAGVHNLYGAEEAEKSGFERVVLSRETKLEDIAEIKRNTRLELEFFVQGALCVSFSGNCYMSAAECAASGNRGMCKQLCRLPYQAYAEGGKQFIKSGFMLSARDLCLLSSLRELIAAGVTSFKIEGRMRRAGYAAQATAVYADALREAEQPENVKTPKRLSDGRDKAEYFKQQERILLKAFNRGGFLHRAYLDGGKSADVICADFNNHTGVGIGVVESVKPFKAGLNEITVKTRGEGINDGDGLKFFLNGAECAGAGVGGVQRKADDKYVFISGAKVEKGCAVNLITDSRAETAALQTQKKLFVNIFITAKRGVPFTVEMRFERNGALIKASAVGEAARQAENAPLSAEQIGEQVKRLGGTVFTASDVTVDTDGVFIAKSQLNALRRACADKLQSAIIADFEKRHNKTVDKKTNERKSVALPSEGFKPHISDDERRVSANIGFNTIVWVYEDKTMPYLSALKNEAAALSLNNFDGAGFDAAYQSAKQAGFTQIGLELPVIANGADIAVLENLIEEKRGGLDFLVADNLYGFNIARKFGLFCIAGFGMNVVNSFCVKALEKTGAAGYVKSFEAKCGLVGTIPEISVKNFALPLMSLAHCPVKTLYNCGCNQCKYSAGMLLVRDNKRYILRRLRLKECYFRLIDKS